MVDSVLLNDLFLFAKNKKVEPDSAENYSRSITTIQNQLKGLIAQDLFNSSAYYQVVNEQNTIYIKALNAFTDGSFQKFGIQQLNAKPTISNNKKKVKKVSKKTMKK
jgi:carboxyl-terminal processing protease